MAVLFHVIITEIVLFSMEFASTGIKSLSLI